MVDSVAAWGDESRVLQCVEQLFSLGASEIMVSPVPAGNDRDASTQAFQMCGAEADGAISWVCPGSYLHDVALPAMRTGADRAGRAVPPLVAHLPVCVHDDPNEAREAVRQQFAGFARAPFYQNMFIAAGFPEVSQGTWSDSMVDSVAAWGDESRVLQCVEQLFSLGASEIMVSPVPAGNDRDASLDRTLRLRIHHGRRFGDPGVSDVRG